MTTYTIEWSNGDTETHDTYDAALSAIRARYPLAEVGHSGDLRDGGARTLAWANEADADNDDGANACAVIKAAEVAS